MRYQSLGNSDQIEDMIEPDEVDKQISIRKVAWKRIHADVFRAPTYPIMFSVLVGTGI